MVSDIERTTSIGATAICDVGAATGGRFLSASGTSVWADADPPASRISRTYDRNRGNGYSFSLQISGRLKPSTGHANAGNSAAPVAGLARKCQGPFNFFVSG